MTSYTNQIGNVWRYSYDALDRRTYEVCVGVTTNGFAHSPASDLTILTDGNGNQTSWNYDQFGRVTNKLDNLGTNLFIYKYDPDNRLTNRWSAAKGPTTYRYDAFGNLTNLDYTGGTNSMSPIYFYYDALNRITNMVDEIGSTVYGYDAAGQLLSEGGLWPDDTVSYTYANRLRTDMSVQAPNASAWTQRYGYDLARRLTSITSPAGTFGYTYDAVELQRVRTLALPGGANITNSFDSVARLISTWLKSSGGTDLDSYVYTYNTAGQRTNVVRTAGDFAAYTYDNAGQLKTANGMESGGVTNRWQEQFGYAYDAAGNLNFRTNNALLQQFNVNTLNELTSTTNGGRLTVAGSTTSPATNVTVNMSNSVLYADVSFASTNQPWANGNNSYTAIAHDVYNRWSTNSVSVNLSATNSFSYDLNGNLLSDGTRNFAYDDENQLVSVWQTNVWRNDFVYDGKMRRRIEKDFSWNGSSWGQTNTVHFIYDGNVVVQERNASNLPQVTYTRGNDLSGTLQGDGGIGGLLARTANPSTLSSQLPTFATSLYHSDGNGNITCLIFSNQTIAAKYLYDPYGNTLAQFGSLADANAYRFSSKEWNYGLGLYYYLYRFYSPTIQRWPNRDPLFSRGGGNRNPDKAEFGINLDKFVDNDPIDAIDPNGWFVWYGNWGGPNWTGGYVGTYEDLVDNGITPLPPIDNQDKCYETHDKCYASCRDDFRSKCPDHWKSAKLQLGNCFRNCDRNLDNCLSKLGDDPSNNRYAHVARPVFWFLGNFGHMFESDPPAR